MRLIVAMVTVACIAACNAQQSEPELTLIRYDDEARQRQAVLDAQAILQGMAQARRRQAQMARTAQ